MSKNRIFLLIFAVTTLGLLAWGFFAFKNRNNDSQTSQVQQQQTQSEQQTIESENVEEQESEDDAIQDSENDLQDTSADNEETESSEIEKTNLLEISRSDCNNKCKNYHKKEELEYCQEYCGIAAKDDEEKSEGCENLSDLKKDYCFKDLAASKEDLDMCNKIEDSGIMKACRNQITEDILDSSLEEKVL